ncbi:MAG: ArsR family transcriptional regulator [Nitrososphaerota archaeon]|nr:ArsR family transcriptional regulator [Nitrososphaerota archaeon]
MESLPSSAEFVSSSRVRVKLLFHLIAGPKSPSELAIIESKHVSHISRALAEMRSRGLVEYLATDSRERYYRVTSEGYAVFTILTRVAK